jgi:L-malate glycosyltransferase
MSASRQPSVVILGPLHLSALAAHVPALSQEGLALPEGSGGYNLTMLVRERLERGWPTDVVTLSPDLPVPLARWEGPNLRLWVVRRRTRRALRDMYLRERQLIQQAVRESTAPVCHAHWTYEFGLAAVGQKEKPYVLTVHDHALRFLFQSGPVYAPLFLATLYVLRKSPFITVVSEYLRPWVRAASGKDPEVVPNLISIGAEPVLARSEGPRLVSALAWTDHKNVKNGLRAFRLLREKHAGVEWELLGPGLESGGEAERWARAHGLDGQVRFRGRCSHAETLAAFARAWVVYHPSMEESFGGPVSEAMWLGVPVVASRQAGGCRWLLDGGKCGGLADGRDAQDMANHLNQALSDVDWRGRVVPDARERIKTLCQPGEILRRYEEIYLRALGAAGRKT